MRRLLGRLRYGSPCGASPPWRLRDAGPCIIGRRVHGKIPENSGWHADGNGFIWNETQWRWMGPTLDLRDENVSDYGEYREPPGGTL